jgi:hypothetical protein
VRLELISRLGPGRDRTLANNPPGASSTGSPITSQAYRSRVSVLDLELIPDLQLLGGQHELRQAELYGVDRHRSTSLTQGSPRLVVDVDAAGVRGGTLWTSRRG